MHIFQNSNFCLKSDILSLATLFVNCFPWDSHLPFFPLMTFARGYSVNLSGAQIWFSETLSYLGLPTWSNGKEPTSHCRRYKRHGFDPWVRKIPRRRAWQSTPAFLSGEFHRQRSWGLPSMGSQRVRHDRSNLACMRTLLYLSFLFP